MTLLKWNKEGVKKFYELADKSCTLTVNKSLLLYSKEKKVCYEMFIGGVVVYVTPKFFNKLIENGILYDEIPVKE